MADDSENSGLAASSETTEHASNSTTSATPPPEDRNALLDRARVFLTSPHVVHEQPPAKRRFLAEKGLDEREIEGLMRELPPQLPAVPPRTYPQPPPSNLPYMLMGMAKVFTWLTGGSAILILIYYKFLLPRLTRSALARRSLKQHQISLLTRLNESLITFRTAQAETLNVLPSPSIPREPSDLARKHSLQELDLDLNAPIDIPGLTLLRCAIEGLAAEGKKATKDELFVMLEEKFPWLNSEKGAEYLSSLWETLTTDSCFSEVDVNGRLVCAYTPPSPPPPTSTPLMDSLSSLKSSLPPPRSKANPYQRTFETLSDFTGYITTQTYALASHTLRMPGTALSMSAPLGPQQEEIRKEIRALKGLVLNRRTFAPPAIRPPFSISPVQTP
ncbi:hypothetical protein DFH11DRAFT_1878504 [Phellopilus nigrolimitatus]|nr:hypothetical protein DFH11DRAFT_1878504 [Phellopilus nigrolimitatus]